MSRPVCIDHLTLPVADVEASRRFYAAALGAVGWAELDVDGHPTWGPPAAEDFSKRSAMAVERPHVSRMPAVSSM